MEGRERFEGEMKMNKQENGKDKEEKGRGD